MHREALLSRTERKKKAVLTKAQVQIKLYKQKNLFATTFFVFCWEICMMLLPINPLSMPSSQRVLVQLYLQLNILNTNKAKDG